jgi:hypothetical protein
MYELLEGIYSSTLKTEGACCAETVICIYQTTRTSHHRRLYSSYYSHGNLKPH